MTNPDLTIRSYDNSCIHIVLSGEVVKHKGSAIIKDGHLYLSGNQMYSDCRTTAAYAPGQWLSAVVAENP